ncbi:hypothetical protein H5410_027764 [Solanum commersonii]|uniref:Uncharacterized protein n=1 Tax=Solanum commersonii TaxID=4109 RepID=A0A9J5Z2T7_SOLCO|nr:hypothetical protein H5410_027764 [Solanum commersonii]
MKNVDKTEDTSQPQRKSVEYPIIKEIEPYHYYITGIIEQRKHIIIINTGQEENYIPRELVDEEEIISKKQACPELPKELSCIEDTIEKKVIIGGIIIQHDAKHAELSPSDDSKIPELEGDDEKHRKTQPNSLLNVATGTSSTSATKEENKTRYVNTNMTKLFHKPFIPKTQKDIFIPPQVNTYKESLGQHK